MANNDNEGTSPLKLFLYVAIIITWALLSFRSCFGCGSEKKSSPDEMKQNVVSTTNKPSKDYSWIVGKWSCNMGSLGTITLIFEGDGTSGSCTEIEMVSYGNGSYKYGSYRVQDDELSYKLNGEKWATTIEIHSGHRLYAGEGYYFHKK